MELKRIVNIFVNYKSLWIGILTASLLCGFIFFHNQPQGYNVTLGMNITRQGYISTQDYQYADFYRLQADEKFSETVTQWLADPRLTADILEKAGFGNNFSKRNLSRFFSAEKMSSQFIQINFSVAEKQQALSISKVVNAAINDRTNSLNKDQKELDWFQVLLGQPLIFPKYIGLLQIEIVSLALGMMISLWAVLLKYYWKKDHEDRN